MCDVCGDENHFDPYGHTDLEKAQIDALEKGQVLQHSKANKGTQYKFAREYEADFRKEMAKVISNSSKNILKKLAEQLEVSKG